MSALSTAINRARFAHFVPAKKPEPKPPAIEIVEVAAIIPEPPKPIPVERLGTEVIIRHIGLKYGMTKEEIKCGMRLKHMVRVRHIAMYVTRKVTKRSFPEIGRRFGYKDHTTIMHAVKKMERERLTDEALDKELSNLIAEFS